jgi:CheY-like chemotaxis protein
MNQDTPIVALSGHAFDDDIEMALSSGMNAHLSKPIDIGKLRKAIVDLVR